MQLDASKHRDTGKAGSGALESPGNGGAIDRAVLAGLDIGLFKALRKLDTPKHRVCSALWLSYEEYDELSRLL